MLSQFEKRERVELQLQEFGMSLKTSLLRDLQISDDRQVQIVWQLEELKWAATMHLRALLYGATQKDSPSVPATWIDMALMAWHKRKPKWLPRWLLRWMLKKHPIKTASIAIERRELVPNLGRAAQHCGFKLARTIVLDIPAAESWYYSHERQPDPFWVALAHVLAGGGYQGGDDYRLVHERLGKELRGVP